MVSMEADITPHTALDMVIRGAGIDLGMATTVPDGMGGIGATAGTVADTAAFGAPLMEETIPLPAGAIVEHTRLPLKTFLL
jgi:hypothetical protein